MLIIYRAACAPVIDETERRRRIQIAYNKEHGIIPQTIKKGVHELLSIGSTSGNRAQEA